MVIASLSRYRGEWVNCTFAVNLLSLLKRILQSRVSKDDSRCLSCEILPFTWPSLPEIGTQALFLSFSLAMFTLELYESLHLTLWTIIGSSFVQTPLKKVSRS